jgi:DNA polymerase-3 subunit beta
VLPILEDFLFEAEKNKLTVVATDLKTVMRVQLDIEAKESGKFVSLQRSCSILKNIADQPLTFTIDSTGSITSDNGKYKAMGENLIIFQGTGCG